MNTTNNILLVEDVMEILGVSTRQTIYNYISEGKLNPINKDDWYIEQRYEFDINDVLKLKEELELPGMTTGEVAKKIGVSQTTVNNYIKKGILPSVTKEYKGRNCHFIKEEDLEVFLAKHQINKPTTKKHFYDKERKIGLFQLFVLKQNGQIESYARIMDLEEPIIALTEREEKLTLEQLLDKGYVPAYEIKELKPITKEGYAHFHFKIPATVKAKTFEIIDTFYQKLSPVNIRIDKKEDDSYLLQVKPVLLDKPFGEFYELLSDSLIKGKIKKRARGIYIDSDIEVIRLRVDSEFKKKLEERAINEQKGLEEYILSVLKNMEQINKISVLDN
ncbi:helix-turn-helix domain-containing protein [Calidifontibacillus erzurumensis]|uniref:helix-turn-helix domain-containing protein n=1 Tax=Calidifontibacillus erzurumensis TaxID=2741433 RepID=UPI0035B53420